MVYRYRCESCGYTVFTEEREKVGEFRDEHRPLVYGRRGPCQDMAVVSDGTVMRQDLAGVMGIERKL